MFCLIQDHISILNFIPCHEKFSILFPSILIITFNLYLKQEIITFILNEFYVMIFSP